MDLDDVDVILSLLSSGNAAVWVAYAWDAENRLVGVGPGGTPKSGDLKLAFVYDYMGRRVEKKVWTWHPQAGQGGDWALTGHRKFVWNGWLLLMELDGLNDDAVLRKRTWGLDLSGLMGGGASAGLASGRSMLEGAGGIGGLLAVHDATVGQNGADYAYFYDANGNVGQLVDLSHTPSDPAGAIVARYEYDPYGNVTSQSGAYASDNPFRFSTKYWDDETGLGYWGYRYYDPKLGRWVNRDPIGEAGGPGLYAYAVNAPAAGIDSLGYAFASCPSGRPRTPRDCYETYGPCLYGAYIIRDGACACLPYDDRQVEVEPCPRFYHRDCETGECVKAKLLEELGASDVYGSCCGANRDCGPDGCAIPLPNDCLDQACARHDECYYYRGYTASGPSSEGRCECDCALATEAKACFDAGQPDGNVVLNGMCFRMLADGCTRCAACDDSRFPWRPTSTQPATQPASQPNASRVQWILR